MMLLSKFHMLNVDRLYYDTTAFTTIIIVKKFAPIFRL
jgi:hypothetical protein